MEPAAEAAPVWRRARLLAAFGGSGSEDPRTRRAAGSMQAPRLL